MIPLLGQVRLPEEQFSHMVVACIHTHTHTSSCKVNYVNVFLV